MKPIFAALGLSLTLALTGCVPLQANIEDLMKPPKLSGEQVEIDRALRAVVGQDIQLKYPIGGEYRSAFVLYNLDQDPEDEAMVFYQRGGDESVTWVSVLDRTEHGWVCQYDNPGQGSEVASIQFAPISSTQRDDVIIAWQNNNHKQMDVCIYSYEPGKLNRLYSGEGDYLYVMDSDKNDYAEVLLLDRGATRSPKATLVRRKGSRVVGATEVNLNSRVTDFEKVTLGTISNGKPAIFIDELIDPETMATEVILVDSARLTNLMREDDEHKEDLFLSTFRPAGISCQDVDGDGVVEVPTQSLLPGYSVGDEDALYLTTYNTMNRASMAPGSYAFINRELGYSLRFPETWRDNVTAIRIPETGELRFVVFENKLEDSTIELLRIRMTSHMDHQDRYETNEVLSLDKKGMFEYYAVIPTTDHPLSITEAQLRECFSLLS